MSNAGDGDKQVISGTSTLPTSGQWQENQPTNNHKAMHLHQVKTIHEDGEYD